MFNLNYLRTYLMLAVMLFTSATAWAQNSGTTTVNNWAELKEAVKNDGAVIELAGDNDYYPEGSGISIDDGTVTIDGKGHTIDAYRLNAHIFEVNSGATLILKNITITNAVYNGDGGAIYNNQGTLKIVNSTLSNSDTDKNNKAIYNYASDKDHPFRLTIINTTMTNDKVCVCLGDYERIFNDKENINLLTTEYNANIQEITYYVDEDTSVPINVSGIDTDFEGKLTVNITNAINNTEVDVQNGTGSVNLNLDVNKYTARFKNFISVTEEAFDRDDNKPYEEINFKVIADNSFSALEDKISNATNNTVTLDKNYIYDSKTDNAHIEIKDKTLTIDGDGHSIDGTNSGDALFVIVDDPDVLDVTNVTLKNITLENGRAISGTHLGSQVRMGGAIFVSRSTLNLINATLKNNTAAGVGGCGGAIYSDFSTLNIIGTTFTDNTAAEGKNLYVQGGNGVSILNSSIEQDDIHIEPDWDNNDALAPIAILKNNIMTISGTGAMADFESADDQPWKDCRTYIKKVTIGADITSISDYAFSGCSNLKTVYVLNGDDPTSLGTDAFKGCHKDLTIYVSDAAVDTYKEFENWSAYASKIKGSSVSVTIDPNEAPFDFVTLDEAIEAASNAYIPAQGETPAVVPTVTLNTDIDLGYSYVTIGDGENELALTLDLNGHQITGAKTDCVVYANCKLTIMDSMEEGGAIINTNTDVYSCALKIGSAGDVTISGGSISGYVGIDNTSGGKLMVTGGTIIGISNSICNYNGSKLTLTEGTIESTGYYTIDNLNESTLTIGSGVTVKYPGNRGIDNSQSTLVLTGIPTFVNTGDENGDDICLSGYHGDVITFADNFIYTKPSQPIKVLGVGTGSTFTSGYGVHCIYPEGDAKEGQTVDPNEVFTYGVTDDGAFAELDATSGEVRFNTPFNVTFAIVDPSQNVNQTDTLYCGTLKSAIGLVSTYTVAAKQYNVELTSCIIQPQKDYQISNDDLTNSTVEFGDDESTIVATLDLNGHTISGDADDLITVAEKSTLTVAGEGSIGNGANEGCCIANSGTLILSTLPTFVHPDNATDCIDIYLEKNTVITFDKAITTFPTEPIVVKMKNAAPYVFTSGYGANVKSGGKVVDPASMFAMVTTAENTLLSIHASEAALYVTQELTFPRGKTTYYSDKGMKLLGENEDLKFYTVTDVTDNTVELTEITGKTFGKQTPLIVSNESEEVTGAIMVEAFDEDEDTDFAASCATDLGEKSVFSGFKGTAVNINEIGFENGKNYFGFTGHDFVRIRKDGPVAAHRCWLEIGGSSNSAARLNINWGEDTTGVEEGVKVGVKEGVKVDDSWYTIDGRKLNGQPTVKGVYIINGKKMVVR